MGVESPQKIGKEAEGTVGKALQVLDMVAAWGRPVRFSDLLDRSPYPKATLYRLLQTLTQQRMLRFDPERQTYAPGLRLVRLAHTAWLQTSLGQVARPHLDALSDKIGETVHLAQLDGGQVLYIDKRNASRPVQMFSEAGKVGPAYCTGVGKAMLAHLPTEEAEQQMQQQSFYRHTPHTITDIDALRDELRVVREQGFAFDREEHEPGIICIAVPILTRAGQVLGGLSVTSTMANSSLKDLEKLLPVMRPAAERIAAEAEDWRFPQTGGAENRTLTQGTDR